MKSTSSACTCNSAQSADRGGRRAELSITKRRNKYLQRLLQREADAERAEKAHVPKYTHPQSSTTNTCLHAQSF